MQNNELKYEESQRAKNELRILLETQLMSLASLQNENKKYKARSYLLLLMFLFIMNFISIIRVEIEKIQLYNQQLKSDLQVLMVILKFITILY